MQPSYRPTSPRRLLRIGVALILPLLAAILFSSALSPPSGGPVAAAAPNGQAAAPQSSETPGSGCTPSGNAGMNIGESGFQPTSLTIAPGTRLTWTNTGTGRHRVRDAGHNLFDSDDFYPGQQFSYVFCTPGTYPIEDERSSATAVVIVSGSPPTPGTGTPGTTGTPNTTRTGTPGTTGTPQVTGTAQTTGTPQVTGTPPGGVVDVSIFNDDSFSPPNLTIQIGTTVRWTNFDDDTHTATSPGGFNSGDMVTGQNWSFTFNTPGSFNYFCAYHSEMQGNITVTCNSCTPTPAVTNTPVSGGTVDVDIQNFAFAPQNLTIQVGTTVRWTNRDSAPHTASSTSGLFESGTLNQNQQYSFTFNTAGSYPYRCNIHPAMTGTITAVNGGGGTPGPTNTAQPSQTAQATPSAQPSQTSVPGVASVVLQNYAFNPATLTVAAGTTVRWTNLDNDNHNVTSLSGLFSSGTLGTNATFQYTFNAPGTYNYECTLHSGFMTGTIIVTGAPPSQTPGTTPSAGPTRTPGTTPSAQPSQTAVSNFSDVQPTDYFYVPVQWLVSRGAISGYADNTFRPYANITRGQITKVLVLAEGWPLVNPQTPTFSDTPPANPFYPFIETAVAHNIISGYADETFRPYNNVTRAQIAKIVVLAEGWTLVNPQQPTFTDVPAASPFYQFIETAVDHGMISGYADGTFRPGANATRGQASKIIYVALTTP